MIHASHKMLPGDDREFTPPHCGACGLKAQHGDIVLECAAVAKEREARVEAKQPAPWMGTLFDRVRYHREAAAIERCHTKPHVLRYSVGHHTHDLLSLIIQCWMVAHEGKLPRAELLVAAQVHDHPELTSGDIPSPIKDLLGEKCVAIDSCVELWLGCKVELTDEELEYLHAADRFELWLWSWEEVARGNREVQAWGDNYEAKWRDKPLPWPFMDLMEEVLANRGVPHLTNAQIQQAGGLS